MQGMVLCGVSKDHSVVKLLQAPEGATVGARVTFPGFTTNGEPASSSQMAKKKILEGLAPLVRTIFVNFSTHFFVVLLIFFPPIYSQLRTDGAGVAHWDQSPFTIAGAGVCSVPGLADAVVS
jgi:hypothetical protein